MKFLILILSTILIVQQVNGASFFLKEGTKKCFIEDLPRDTLVVGNFETNEIVGEYNFHGEHAKRKSADAIGTNIEVLDSEKQVLVERQFSQQGRFAFTSKTAGEHTICFKSNTTRWFGAGSIKIELELDSGADANDYKKLKALEDLTDLEVLIKMLNDKVNDIRKEQNYYKTREAELRNESEMANSNVMWFSLIQTFILLASGIWQIQHLRKFFKSKKLV